jgi:mono/diheme cytochrome c family protein
MSDEPESQPPTAPLYGLLAEYDTPKALIAASKRVREAGYARWDTYTPFPIHGIERAMGIKMTVLPWIVLAAGLSGFATAVWLQWWTNTVDYPWLISGKPFFTAPANVPIWFELTVLFSAFAALGGMLMLNGLPLPAHPLDLKQRFARATDDKFFLVVEATDPNFDDQDTRALLDETSPVVVEEVATDQTTSDKLPPVLVYGVVILSVAALVPLALFAKARYTKSSTPRLHVVLDMDDQPKYKAQQVNPLFDDQRADRPPVPGTIPVGELKEDDHLHRGRLNDAWALTFPPSIEPTITTMTRGRERFGISCAPCHGLSGAGDGMINKRAQDLKQGTWVPPTNFHQDYLRQMPVGELFNSITNGIRNMPAYGSQITVEDRWAIVMYLRALQRSRAASIQDVPAEDRIRLK